MKSLLVKLSIIVTGFLTLLVGFLVSASPDIHSEGTYNKVAPSVYYAYLVPGASGGTGFVINNHKGLKVFITNAHVCDQAESIYLAQDGDRTVFESKVLRKDVDHDLCETVAPPKAVPLHLAPTAPHMFQELMAVGHPHLDPITPGFGRILSLYRTVVIMGMGHECAAMVDGPIIMCMLPRFGYFTDINIQPGNSGSPVVNAWGEVEGVAFIAGPSGSLLIRYEEINKFLE